MAIGSDTRDYWLQRLAQAIEQADKAPTERSCTAYLDLARHYWSMHLMVNGPRAGGDIGGVGLDLPDLARPIDPAGGPELQRAA